ncbi:hypothetical protein BACINT_04465 [Bacteroides intestinalis DSM 17393]|jgi:hypothetical protein|uniref:Uncharacterized protein n=1 Tax=Bacteroides intestinalis DSM 17393 TaxID=471870 RepID=B3CG42_9BACE|nr:hypothetical protein BACINT_04465 [Bacteroides intestinalis DSM 17393]
MEKVAFHHGETFFPPWWKEKTSMVERISIRMEKANRWKGKNIRMPKKEVSYCS